MTQIARHYLNTAYEHIAIGSLGPPDNLTGGTSLDPTSGTVSCLN